MVVNPPEGLATERLQDLNCTSIEQPTEQVRTLLLTLSNEQLSLKGLMEKIGLKHRSIFI